MPNQRAAAASTPPTTSSTTPEPSFLGSVLAGVFGSPAAAVVTGAAVVAAVVAGAATLAGVAGAGVAGVWPPCPKFCRALSDFIFLASISALIIGTRSAAIDAGYITDIRAHPQNFGHLNVSGSTDVTNTSFDTTTMLTYSKSQDSLVV